MASSCAVMLNSRSAHRLDDPNKIRTADVVNAENDNKQFSDLHFPEKILNGLSNAGFLRPSPVQWSALPLAKIGVDLIVQSKSGTGKTLVYVVTALNMIDTSVSAVQAVILTPTREIAVQGARISLDIAAFSMPDLKVSALIGGMSIQDDASKLKRCHIVVGTPGRIRQLIDEKYFKTEAVRFFALDEADKMLESSFKNDVTWIYNQLPPMKQVMALSATYPETLAKTLTNLMRDPKHVRLDTASQVLLGLDQYVVNTNYHPKPRYQLDVKFRVLLDILNSITFSQCLIFTNYSLSAQTICERLNGNGWPAIFIAANLQNQYERLNALNSLRQFTTRIMVTTDLSARGVDAANVTLVINFDVPWDSRTFLHRSGRAGRFGSRGINITLASEGDESNMLRKVVFRTGTKIKKIPYVTRNSNVNSDNENSITDYTLPDLWKLDSDKTKEEVEKYELVEGLECPMEDLEEQIRHDVPNDSNKNEVGQNGTKEKRKKNRRKKKKDHVDQEAENLASVITEETYNDDKIEKYSEPKELYSNIENIYLSVNGDEVNCDENYYGEDYYDEDYYDEEYYDQEYYDEEYYDEEYYDEETYDENKDLGQNVNKDNEKHSKSKCVNESYNAQELMPAAVLHNDLNTEYAGQEEEFFIARYGKATGYKPINHCKSENAIKYPNLAEVNNAKEQLSKHLKSKLIKQEDKKFLTLLSYEEMKQYTTNLEKKKRNLDINDALETNPEKVDIGSKELVKAANIITQYEHDKWETSVHELLNQVQNSDISIPTFLEGMINGENISDILKSKSATILEKSVDCVDIADNDNSSKNTPDTESTQIIAGSKDINPCKTNDKVKTVKSSSKLKTPFKNTCNSNNFDVGPDGLPKWIPVENDTDAIESDTNGASFDEVYRQGKHLQ